MPAHQKVKQSRRFTTAGLIAVSAATLLMMAWAIFPTAAFADGSVSWVNHQGLAEGATCPNGAHWILSPPGDITGATLHVGGETITMNQNGQGGSFEADSSGPVTNSTSASADFTSPNDEDDPHLVLSHCLGGPTTTSSTTTESTTTESTTTPTTTTESTTTPTTTTESTSTTQSTPTSTTSTTETSTTTESPTVSPTTVTPSSSTDEVAPTTVTPGGTAFTGVENVVPLGAIALMLMTSGSGLLWAGTRRRRDDSENEE